MVPSPSTRPREQAAGYPQRETSRPLPVLRTSDELPKSPEVPTERPTYLEEVARTKVAGKGPDLDKVRANPSTPPAPTSQDRTTSDQNGESPEEPTGVIPRGGICEGGGSYGTMANLSGHAAGNGGYRQGDPTVSFDSLLLGRRHHSKPGPRLDPTRLRGEDPDDPLLLGGKG